MKAKTLSLIGKGVGLLVILVTWAYMLFVKNQASAVDVIAYSGAITALFVDVAVNLGIDKFKKEVPTTPDGVGFKP
jgi:hypothetical protein